MTETLRDRMHRELTAKTLLQQARQAADDYLEASWDRRIFPSADAVEGLTRFDEPLPEETTDASHVLAQLARDGAPATVVYGSGRYFGFVTGGVVPASMAARLMSDVWDQASALHVMSPVASKLESVCEAWIKDLFGFDDDVRAGFVSGSSVAIFCSIAAAREHAFARQGWDFNRQGFNGAPKLRLVASAQSHGTVKKGIALMGFGLDSVEWVPCDDQGRMIADQLPELDSSCIVFCQAGNVNSGSFDPFEEICAKARAAGAWVHVDGAFGLWAGASSRLKHHTKGMELANSWSLDGHKTLNTPYDNGIVLCRHGDALVRSLQAQGSYIVYGENRDGMMYTPEMSRRARSVELWAAMKYLGRRGIDEMVTTMHDRTVQFADALAQSGWRIRNEVAFNQVMVSLGTPEQTQRAMALMQAEGECWAGPGQWQDEPVIRISVSAWATSEEDVVRSVASFNRAKAQAEQE